MRREVWCLWCGEGLTQTRRDLGDYCGASCLRAYHEDVGGYGWALDLLGIAEQRGCEVDEPVSGRGGIVSRKGTT